MSRFFPDDFEMGTLLSRPNRFVVYLLIDGKKRGASLPNPGKLGELFIPGAVLFVHRMRSEVKYAYRVIAVISNSDEVIMLDTHRNNRVAEHLINKSLIPSLKDYSVVKREVTVGNSRFDLLLEDHSGNNLYCEVKSCTLFGGGLAMFPDAVTSRGKRHIDELANMADSGIRTAVLFVVQSANIRFFSPDYHTDPDFSDTIYANRNKVKIIPVTAGWDKSLNLIPDHREIPVLWELYQNEGKPDSGSYLMLFNLEKDTSIEMENFGIKKFNAGFYLYISYETDSLGKKIERYRRKRKRCMNQRDYLRNNSSLEMVWPIRTSENESCMICNEVEKISDGPIDDFDSLFYFKNNPKINRDFQEILINFRMRYPLKKIQC